MEEQRYVLDSRVAILEEKVSAIKSQLTTFELELQRHEEREEANMKALNDKLATVMTSMQSINLQLEKQKGFVGGLQWVLAGMWMAISALIAWFK